MDKDELLREFAYTILSDPTHMSQYHILSRLYELAEKAEIILGLKIGERIKDFDEFVGYIDMELLD